MLVPINEKLKLYIKMFKINTLTCILYGFLFTSMYHSIKLRITDEYKYIPSLRNYKTQ